jgi:cytochrome bd-type quinol oxidase subunit 2
LQLTATDREGLRAARGGGRRLSERRSGRLFFAFPAAYASGFSGFYLPLMIVVWLLILRGIAVEFRNHVASPVWTPFWDVVFAGASALLAVFFGAALGNVMRGGSTRRERFLLSSGRADKLNAQKAQCRVIYDCTPCERSRPT